MNENVLTRKQKAQLPALPNGETKKNKSKIVLVGLDVRG